MKGKRVITGILGLAVMGTALTAFGGCGVEKEAQTVALAIEKIAAEDYAENGIEAQALSAYTVTATVKDEMGLARSDIQSVTYSLAWAVTMPESVSEYVRLTQSGMKATVTCLQAFGTRVRLTCRSNKKTSVSAGIYLDYENRVSMTLANVYGMTNVTVENGGSISIAMPSRPVNVGNIGNQTWQQTCALNPASPTVSEGTTGGSGTYTKIGAYIRPSSALKSALTNQGLTPSATELYSRGYNQGSATLSISLYSLLIELCGMGAANPNISNGEKVYQALKNAGSNQFEVEAVYGYNGSNVSFKYYLNFTGVTV